MDDMQRETVRKLVDHFTKNTADYRFHLVQDCKLAGGDAREFLVKSDQPISLSRYLRVFTKTPGTSWLKVRDYAAHPTKEGSLAGAVGSIIEDIYAGPTGEWPWLMTPMDDAV